jgi:glutaminase
VAGAAEVPLTGPYVSTGQLPSLDRVRELVAEAHERFRAVGEGANSQVYPALECVDPELFGICVAGANGNLVAAGDDEVEFSIMSVSKPFVFALVCAAIGPAEVRRRVGVNATGLPFNSIAAVEQSADGRTNPMVNPGAIATTSLVAGATSDDKWAFIRDGLSAFAGRELSLDDEIYASASASNHRNRGIARLLDDLGCLGADPDEAVELYTMQCSLAVSAKDLAVMGATLADGGVNPLTGARVVGEASCRHTLAVMASAGLYETSGDWLYEIGLPGKSGIGGGVVTVSPGKGGLGTFAPRLDESGTSVKGKLVAAFLAERLGLDLFASAPDTGIVESAARML